MLEAIKALEQTEPEKCGDCISRQAAIDALNDVSENYTGKGEREWHPHLDFMVDAIKAVPSVEPERKVGKWILHRTFPTKLYDEYINEYKCSECYREIRCTESQLVNYLYCHCGAKMKVDGE